jgi:hypothetical protein
MSPDLRIVPILRIFSVEKAREFYLESLLDPFGNEIRSCEPKSAEPTPR